VQNVFLTGATGTIGSAILEVLASTKEYSVDCLQRHPESRTKIELLGGNFLLGDMTDADRFQEITGRKDYSYIVHSAQAHYAEHPASAIHAMDVQAVANLERLQSAATKLMVYTSGVWIFGHQKDDKRISETAPHHPFPSAKDRSDLVRKMLGQRSSPWAHLCPPSIVYGDVGPMAEIARSMRPGPLEIIDDESVKWSVIERIDLAKAYLALLRVALPGEFYVVSEDNPIPVVAFYESVARCVPGSRVVRRSRSHFEKVFGEGNLETKYANQPVDPSLFKNRTGWRARESFATSVCRFLSKDTG
jgi:nucleoside-diphosphate-sugar epimerase